MIVEALHLLSCIAFVVFSIRWRNCHLPEKPIYCRMLPFTISTSLLGMVIPFRYMMELFVASYSGALYEVQAPTRGHFVWMLVSALLLLLPLAAFIPAIARRHLLLTSIGCLAAVPSILSLASTLGIVR